MNRIGHTLWERYTSFLPLRPIVQIRTKTGGNYLNVNGTGKRCRSALRLIIGATFRVSSYVGGLIYARFGDSPLNNKSAVFTCILPHPRF